MAKIKSVTAREVFTAYGTPTLEVTIGTDNGSLATAQVPLTRYPTQYEAYQLIDHDPQRWNGWGVGNAMQIINDTIAPKLLNLDVTKQQAIDRLMIELDGTQNKSRLGANTMLCVSMAVAKAAAKATITPLYLYLRSFLTDTAAKIRVPTPMVTLLSGGIFAPGLPYNEYLLIPASSMPFYDAMTLGIQTYQLILQAGNTASMQPSRFPLSSTAGGLSLTGTDYDACALIEKALSALNRRVGVDVFMGITPSGGHLYRAGSYILTEKNEELSLSARALSDRLIALNKIHPLLYIEDPLFEDDWEGWAGLRKTLESTTLISGGTHVATSIFRLQMALDKKTISALTVLPLQAGTVIETIALIEVARKAGCKVVMGRAQEETTDTFTADLAVGCGADYIKCGGPQRGEHVAIYNRLSFIDQQIRLIS